MNRLEYKGYVGVFNFDPEAKLFHGEVVGIRDILTFQGRSLAELEKALKDSVEVYLAKCQKKGKEPDKPYSGEIQPTQGS